MAPKTKKSAGNVDAAAIEDQIAGRSDHYFLKTKEDHYFLKTKEIVERYGDVAVTYAVFMRRPVLFAPRLMLAWLKDVADVRGFDIDIELNYQEGQWAGAGEPLVYITGPMSKLVDLETRYLQNWGPRASPPTTPLSCAPSFPTTCSWPWTRATAPAPTRPS